MKKIFVLLCAVALMTVACEREEPTSGGDNPNQTYPPTAEVIHNAVTDYDGNSYDAVRIGSQVWMASNLRTTHYANGEAIPEGGGNFSLVQPYRYNPYTTDILSYGYLYNWSAVMHGASGSDANPSEVQGICPNGWHVPSAAEWTQLTDYCAGRTEYVCACSGSGNKIAKSLAANHGWMISDCECAIGNDLSSNNVTGFSALPANCIHGYNSGYDWDGLHDDEAYFWSATEEYDEIYNHCIGHDYIFLYSEDSFTSLITDPHNGQAFSVRCVRN